MFTSAMMAIRMVVAVSPTSVPAALATGEAPVGSGTVESAEPDAAGAAEVAAADELAALLPALLLVLLLLDELHPAASMTAATRPAIRPATRTRLRVRCPAPPRPGPALIGLTLALHDFIACEL